MERTRSFVVNYRHLSLIRPVFILGIALAAIGFIYPADLAAVTQSQEPLVVKADISSARALSAIKNRYGDIADLLYLYPVNGNDEIMEMGFPGELIVSPDRTPLGELLSNKSSKIKIKAEIETLDRLFQADAPPAAKVTDRHHLLVGIIATKEAMEPFRTGAVVRVSQDRSGHDVSQDVTHDTGHGVKTDALAAEPANAHAAKAETKTDAGHPTPTPTETSHATAEAGSEHTSQTAHVSEHDAGHDAAEPAQTASAEQAKKPADHGKTTHNAGHAESGDNPSGHAQSDHAQSGTTHDAPGHPQAADTHGEHGPAQTFDPSLPRGVALIDAIQSPLDFELNERFWGWRPNDLVFTGDNVENFQLGVLEITRRTAIILSERVSRTGESSAFDPKLEDAMNWLMIKPDRYWFPSAESKYRDALEALESYKEKLAKKQAKFFNRADNLIPLLMAYEDLLGSCEENLVKTAEEDGTPVSFYKSDDYLFYTKGVTSALLTILTAIEHDFGDIIASRQAEGDIHHAITSCHHAIEIDPILVMNNDASSIFANHRANLAAPISHARFYISVLIKTLST